MSGNDRDNRGFVDFSSAPPSAHALKIVVMAGRDEVGEIHVCSPSWSASVVNRGQAVRGNRPSRPGISRALAREFALLSVRHPVLGRLTGQRPRGRSAQIPRSTPVRRRRPVKNVEGVVLNVYVLPEFAGPPSVWQLSSGVGRNAAAIRVNRYLFVARLMVRGITADIAMLRVHRSQSVECESKGNSCGPISRRPVGIKPTVGIARSPSEAVIELVRRARDVVIACLQVRERICHWR